MNKKIISFLLFCSVGALYSNSLEVVVLEEASGNTIPRIGCIISEVKQGSNKPFTFNAKTDNQGVIKNLWNKTSRYTIAFSLHAQSPYHSEKINFTFQKSQRKVLYLKSKRVIEGKIVDLNGRGISGIRVYFRPLKVNDFSTRGVLTNEKGEFKYFWYHKEEVKRGYLFVNDKRFYRNRLQIDLSKEKIKNVVYVVEPIEFNQIKINFFDWKSRPFKLDEIKAKNQIDVFQNEKEIQKSSFEIKENWITVSNFKQGTLHVLPSISNSDFKFELKKFKVQKDPQFDIFVHPHRKVSIAIEGIKNDAKGIILKVITNYGTFTKEYDRNSSNIFEVYGPSYLQIEDKRYRNIDRLELKDGENEVELLQKIKLKIIYSELEKATDDKVGYSEMLLVFEKNKHQNFIFSDKKTEKIVFIDYMPKYILLRAVDKNKPNYYYKVNEGIDKNIEIKVEKIAKCRFEIKGKVHPDDHLMFIKDGYEDKYAYTTKISMNNCDIFLFNGKYRVYIIRQSGGKILKRKVNDIEIVGSELNKTIEP